MPKIFSKSLPGHQLLFLSIAFYSSIITSSCRVSRDPLRKKALALERGKIVDDTSYVYSLPYAKGTSHLLIQGYFSHFSHKNRAALDFKMKTGTKIYAARNGVVIRLEEQHNKGGRNKKYRKDANLVVIEHDDGTKAGYWHLQQNGVLVNIGDTVKQGQLMALSGKTGYTFLPHLHFIVWGNNKGEWRQVPTRFLTSKGVKYLRPLRKYCNPR
ncbi:MAG: M23 family metallopeptidase [Ginsengibacter sp.]